MSLILLIDPDPKFRSGLSEHLTSERHMVIEAEDCRLGMRLFIKCAPELVVVDVAGPAMEGMQRIQELRAIHEDVPIIATATGSMHGGLNVLELARRFGANRAFQRPIDVADVLAAVRDELAAHPAA